MGVVVVSSGGNKRYERRSRNAGDRRRPQSLSDSGSRRLVLRHLTFLWFACKARGWFDYQGERAHCLETRGRREVVEERIRRMEKNYPSEQGIFRVRWFQSEPDGKGENQFQ